jgi:glutathione S-transferase
MLTLYYHSGACSLAPHIILEETGAPFAAKRINLLAGEHQTPDYLAINPHGRVPALTDGDFVLTEGPAILSWLGHRFPEAGLLDLADLEKLGRTQELLNFFSSSVHIAFAQIWRAARFADSEAAREEVMESGRRAAGIYFAELNDLVPDGNWAVGGVYSIADPYLLVFYRWATRIGTDMGAFPGWTAPKNAMLVRGAVQRALATEEIEIA